jgi:two-component system sensor histidine kinase MtrB
VARIGASVRNQAERIARLADDLYDVSRLDSGQLVLSVRAVDVASVVHAALASVRERQEVEVKIPFGVEAMADPRRLEQVIANLVENGLSHGAPPVVVELLSAAEGQVEIAITDHGPGVDPALVEALFSGLRTLPRPDQDGSRGTGVGLTLVTGVVEAMGGTVVYEPAPEGGARFVVKLPRR